MVEKDQLRKQRAQLREEAMKNGGKLRAYIEASFKEALKQRIGQPNDEAMRAAIRGHAIALLDRVQSGGEPCEVYVARSKTDPSTFLFRVGVRVSAPAELESDEWEKVEL